MGVNVDGKTVPVGLVGWPVDHSRSPAFQNAAFRSLGLNFVYLPLPVRPARLPAAVQGLAALGFAGANVTVPHKTGVLPLLDEISPAAHAIGAVNTIVVRPDGALWGENTDAYGFMADLRAQGYEAGGGTALVLGSGGAARAVVYALAADGVEIAVAGRTERKTIALVDAIRAALPDVRISAHPFPDALPELAPNADLIVNATSLGLHPDDPLPWRPDVTFRRGQMVYDLVYTPGPRLQALDGAANRSPFLALAAAAGARISDGLGMLVHQGARSFELWTGRPAPLDVMMQAAHQ